MNHLEASKAEVEKLYRELAEARALIIEARKQNTNKQTH